MPIEDYTTQVNELLNRESSLLSQVSIIQPIDPQYIEGGVIGAFNRTSGIEIKRLRAVSKVYLQSRDYDDIGGWRLTGGDASAEGVFEVDYLKVPRNDDTTGRGVHLGDLSIPGMKFVHFKGDDDSDHHPGVLVLYAHNGTPYYLWADSTGDLRIHTAAPTNELTSGVVVGSQS